MKTLLCTAAIAAFVALSVPTTALAATEYEQAERAIQRQLRKVLCLVTRPDYAGAIGELDTWRGGTFPGFRVHATCTLRSYTLSGDQIGGTVGFDDPADYRVLVP